VAGVALYRSSVRLRPGDIRGQKTGALCYVIRPDGFKIPRDAERVHDISTSMAKRTGVPIAEALSAFVESLGNASVVVAHNFKFDFKFDANVLGAEFHRLGVRDQVHRKTRVCTMEAAT